MGVTIYHSLNCKTLRNTLAIPEEVSGKSNVLPGQRRGVRQERVRHRRALVGEMPNRVGNVGVTASILRKSCGDPYS